MATGQRQDGAVAEPAHRYQERLMPSDVPDVITRYFQADTRRDIDAIVTPSAGNPVIVVGTR